MGAVALLRGEVPSWMGSGCTAPATAPATATATATAPTATATAPAPADGSGYGYGDGYGYGSGDGYGEYWSLTISGFATKWPEAQRARLTALREAGAKIAFWRSNPKGLPSNGGKASLAPAAPGVVHTENGPLKLCAKGTLHATLIPTKWQGERWWIVALIGEVQGDDEKYGALQREIIGECLD